MRSVRDIVALGNATPHLCTLVEQAGETVTRAAIKGYLIAMNDDMHLPNGLTPSNIEDISERLASDPEITHWLTLADVRLLTKRIGDGEYMRFNNRFGKDDFYMCLARYCGERARAHEEKRQQEANEMRETMRGAAVNVGYTIGADGQIIVDERKTRARQERDDKEADYQAWKEMMRREGKI